MSAHSICYIQIMSIFVFIFTITMNQKTQFFREYCSNLPLNFPNCDGHRSSHQRYSMKKGVLRNFTKFAGKHLCQSPFFDKVADLRPARLWHRCFPVNLVKFLGTTFYRTRPDDCFCDWNMSSGNALMTSSICRHSAS